MERGRWKRNGIHELARCRKIRKGRNALLENPPLVCCSCSSAALSWRETDELTGRRMTGARGKGARGPPSQGQGLAGTGQPLAGRRLQRLEPFEPGFRMGSRAAEVRGREGNFSPRQ